MIPFFDGHLFDVAGIPIHMFGVLVAMGVILGDRIVVRRGVERGLEDKDVKFLNARIVIVGFIVAHLVSVIFYFPERIKESPLILLNVWAGLSSFGGFLGALLAFLYYTRKEKIPALPYADGPRHDLGLDELLFTIVMTAILFAYAKKPRVPGRVIGLFATMYAPVRFGLDFLRARDVERPDERYANLTPAQWACLATIGVGVWLLVRKGEVLPFSAPRPPVPPVAPPAEPAAPDTAAPA
jgi:phosphatidylglycerol---prolipoprotein diacylglyceryl transferase